MPKHKGHWTATSIEDFAFRISMDFISQLENALDEGGAKQYEFANALGVTPGRVSQILNSPGNLTLKKIVAYSRALGRKAAIVLYDDRDPKNTNGPVNSQIFAKCWEERGNPADFFALEKTRAHQGFPVSLSGSSGFTGVPSHRAGLSLVATGGRILLQEEKANPRKPPMNSIGSSQQMEGAYVK